VRRREVIALLGGGTVVLQAAIARAEQTSPAVIGWLAGPPLNASPALPYFRQSLADLGYVEGRNLVIEYRSAEFHNERFPDLAADLVQKHVSVIAAVSGLPAVLVAKAATRTIPIVFLTAGDPVQLGLVASFNRPGGNLTGVTINNTAAAMKQIEFLHELVPNSEPIAILSDPNTEAADLETTVRTAERALGRRFFIVYAATGSDFAEAFATMVREHAAGLVVPDRPLFVVLHSQLAALAAPHAIPTVYSPADLLSSGGLMSYGASTFDAFRQIGAYVGKILAGAKPADLPVARSTKIELKINLKTAKLLGITVPQSLLGRADEVIE
jgi:putative tryptophan/tyrosine transport system substrate-binding protein